MKRKEKKNADIPKIVSPVEQESINLLQIVHDTEDQMRDMYAQMVEDPESEEIEGNAESLKRTTLNITKSLTQIYGISDEFNARLKDIKKQKRKKKLKIPTYANAMIDINENKSNHFAKGLNLYKILLICFVGSFVGVIVELLWCLVKNGYIESRSGLVYGPFNLLYGAGAVLLTVCLYKFRNRGAWISFLGGILVGSVVEYICSWGQEMLFGSRSWDYSHMPFNINGRICLLYSIFWGFLGVLWIKRIYPVMAECILKIPNKAGKIITWILVAFFAFNSFMTLTSMARWTQRMNGIEPSTKFEEFIDNRFTDSRMEKIFANMKFID